MLQKYHANAKTNRHNRECIQNASECISSVSLANQFKVSKQTIYKWRNRVGTDDRSSRPKVKPSTIYNILVKHNLNTQPKEVKETYKSFKEYAV